VIVDLREQRGREIAARARIVKRNDAWIVPSESGKGAYRVTLDADDLRCTCEDFELRAKPCKHIFAAAIVVQRETVTQTTMFSDGETTTETTTVTETETRAVRLTYAQNWPAYNRAQTQEKAMFCTLLRDIAATVPEPVQTKGRPRIPMADAIFCGAFKVYSTVSSRRFMTDLREAHSAGLVSRAWHFNSVLNCIDDAELTPILYDLVTASAAPLAAVESTFAVDSTGFGTTQYYRHFTAKYGGQEIESHDWLKLHAIVGTKTNVIGAASITDRNAHDSPQFAPLMQVASQTFDIQTVTADKAYCSRDNVALAAHLGASPYIALRSNSQASSVRAFGTPSRSKDSIAWRHLWHLYNLHRDDFLARYHARSNVESTFSSMKRVFGDTLRSKTRVAQTNELLLKVIVHNIVCLIHSMLELDVALPGFHAA
jgi:transposase